jgi:hypothetical protein
LRQKEASEGRREALPLPLHADCPRLVCLIRLPVLCRRVPVLCMHTGILGETLYCTVLYFIQMIDSHFIFRYIHKYTYRYRYIHTRFRACPLASIDRLASSACPSATMLKAPVVPVRQHQHPYSMYLPSLVLEESSVEAQPAPRNVG